MDEYIGCRNCESPDCKGCNLKNLETMLNNGKFDYLMNENRCINPAADVAPVRHGRWIYEAETIYTKSGYRCSVCRTPLWLSPDVPQAFTYCPNCGAKMDG